MQVTPLHRPLPPGEGRGEGLPAISDRALILPPALSLPCAGRLALMGTPFAEDKGGGNSS